MKNAFISVCSLSLSRFVQSYSPGWSEHRSIAMPATLSRNIALVGRVHSCDDTLISPISRTRKNRSKSKKERKILSSTCSNDLSLTRIVEEGFILSRFPFRFNPWSSTGRRKLRDRNSEARVVEVVFEFKVGGFYFFNCLLLFFLFFERREWLVRREGRRGVPFAGTSNKLDNRSAMFVYPYVCAVALRV